MKTISALMALCCQLAGPAAIHAATAAEDSAWIHMWNGKDLNDWDIKIRHQPLNQDPQKTFIIVNGNLSVDYTHYTNWDNEPYGHMAYKVRPFSYYLLRGEYQFITNGQVSGGPGWAKENNGFMLHSQSMASMGLDQDFPISLEAQLLGPANGSGTMNLCTPGTNYHDMTGKLITDHCTNAKPAPRPPYPAWTQVQALVLGDSLIKYMVGQDTVFKFTKPTTGGGNVSGNTVKIVENAPLTGGYITIQSESAPCIFRKIDVLDLVGCMDKSKAAYRSYFVKNDPNACTATAIKTGAGVQATDFSLLRSGNLIRIGGADARLVEVRRTDGTLAVRFPEGGAAVTAYAPGNPGVYLVTVKTASGLGTGKVTFF